ncbi:hypothetical protein [Flammeovirga sp. SubArs3]|uniref:hypothetical protein n=1 Tax=Flammeovirga sp. SubArs3 TaxID=2995316 RepID=UPI00248C7F26|nr:hypothetical protein [Flammeovirga sp. SubArs3]
MKSRLFTLLFMLLLSNLIYGQEHYQWRRTYLRSAENTNYTLFGLNTGFSTYTGSYASIGNGSYNPKNMNLAISGYYQKRFSRSLHFRIQVGYMGLSAVGGESHESISSENDIFTSSLFQIAPILIYDIGAGRFQKKSPTTFYLLMGTSVFRSASVNYLTVEDGVDTGGTLILGIGFRRNISRKLKFNMEIQSNLSSSEQIDLTGSSQKITTDTFTTITVGIAYSITGKKFIR